MSETRSFTLALDARTVHRPLRRGTGKNLCDLYRQVLSLRPDWAVLGFHRGDDARGLDAAGYRPCRIEMPGDRFDAWNRWRLPLAARLHAADLLHCPANTCPRWNPLPVLLTVHDLLPLEKPGRAADQFRASLRHAVHHRLTIITPSRYTASQLVVRLGASPDQIVVNPWAPDAAMRCVEADERRPVLDRFGLTGPFILHLGAADPRKNTAGVLRAFARLPRPLREHWTLLIVGLDAPAARHQAAALAEELNITPRVRIAGFAEEADVPALFSAADLLLYPSLGEGFGLPILDAWIARTPVLTSNTTSLPEVAGDAAVCVDPLDDDAVAHHLAALLDDASLRRQLIARGRQRVAQFTWRATAERFISAVHTALDRAGGRRRAA